MKKMYVLIAVIFFSNSIFSQNTWLTNFDKAKKVASAEHKNILLVISGSDWCLPCIKLEKEILTQPDFVTYATTNLVIINADFPKRKKNKAKISNIVKSQNEKLFEKYNKNGYFPFVAVLTSKGELMGDLGYLNVSPKAYAQHIEYIIRDFK